MGVPALDVGTVPVQASEPVPPLAVQEVALVVDQEKLVLLPTNTLSGDAAKVLTAAGLAAGLTTSVVLAGPLAPPGPLQFSV